MDVKKLSESQPTSSCRLINFDEARVFFGFNPNLPLLEVSGLAPCANMTVRLQPLIYIRCPEYWGIEVVGCLPGDFCLEAVEPYQELIDLKAAGAIGSKGIKLIGANGSKKFDVSGGCEAGYNL